MSDQIAPTSVEDLFAAEVALRAAAVRYGEAKISQHAASLRAAATEYARLAALFESAIADVAARRGGLSQ